jgi:hypothetical protein
MGASEEGFLIFFWQPERALADVKSLGGVRIFIRKRWLTRSFAFDDFERPSEIAHWGRNQERESPARFKQRVPRVRARCVRRKGLMLERVRKGEFV